jgi:hypothetical protein
LVLPRSWFCMIDLMRIECAVHEFWQTQPDNSHFADCG